MMAKKLVRATTSAPERRYEIEDAMRTLARAEQIRKDAKLMNDVRTLATDLKKVVQRGAK